MGRSGGRTDARTRSVVVVDDHHAVRVRLVDLLETQGFDVLAAVGTYAEGHRAIIDLRPQLAVVDHRLGDGLGIELCAELSALCPEVITIIHTGSIIEPARSASAHGAAAVVEKSARPRRLIEVMTELIGDSSTDH